MADEEQKSAFDTECSMCGEPRRLIKLPAKKGMKRVRVCDNCDRVGLR